MQKKEDADHVRELVEQLNKLRTAAETLEHSKNTLDQALLDRSVLVDGFKETNAVHSLRLDQVEQILAEIQSAVAKLVPINDLGGFPDTVGYFKDGLAAQQKLIEDANGRINLLFNKEAEQQASIAGAIQSIEARHQSLQLDFKSLYADLLLVKEQILHVRPTEPTKPPDNRSTPNIETEIAQILKKVAGYKTQVNWLIIALILQFVLLGGAIMAILTSHIF